jgi:O-antigen ligase
MVTFLQDGSTAIVALAVAALICQTIIGLISPWAGLCFLIATLAIPFRIVSSGTSVYIYDACFICSLFVIAVSRLGNYKRSCGSPAIIKTPPMITLILAPLLYGLLIVISNLGNNLPIIDCAKELLKWVEIVGTVLLIRVIVNSQLRARQLLLIALGVFTIRAILAVSEGVSYLFEPNAANYQRSTMGFSAALGFILAFSLLSGEKTRRSLMLGLSLTGLFGVFASLSRGAWILAACLGAFTTYMTQKRRAIIYMGLLIMVVFAGLIMLLPGVETAASTRLATFLPTSENLANIQRPLLLEYAWVMFLEKPIAGNGLGSFEKAISDRFWLPGYNSLDNLGPHNTYLMFMAETGLLGFLFLISIIWHLSAEIFSSRLSKETCEIVAARALWLACLAYLLVADINGDYRLLFGVIGGISTAVAANFGRSAGSMLYKDRRQVWNFQS